MRIGTFGKMCDVRRRGGAWLLWAGLSFACAQGVSGQEPVPPGEEDFGPVVRAYLGYLRAEQEVTDDRASRREVSPAYVRRNSNRIRALRQMALRIARETKNDYLPELYAVARDELGTLFETPPTTNALASFRAGEVLENTFRFLGPVRAGETFYLFARLDVYEQAELMKKSEGTQPKKPAEARETNAPSQTGNAASQTGNASKEAANGDATNRSAASVNSATGKAETDDATAGKPASGGATTKQSGQSPTGEAATRPRRVPARTEPSAPPPAPAPARTDKPR
jgi:hypothetical protein